MVVWFSDTSVLVEGSVRANTMQHSASVCCVDDSTVRGSVSAASAIFEQA